MRYAACALVVVALGACARQSDVNRVETQLRQLRVETARADSARAVQLSQVLQLQRRILDSLALQENRLVAFRGDIRSDLTEIQKQLVQVQELTGQSQQRLTELRGQIESRSQTVATPGNSPTGGAGSPGSGGMSAEQVYDISMQQLRRGSPATARQGFQMLLQSFPTHERAAEAMFQIGESWGSNGDSAQAYYEQVVKAFPNSARAPESLYKLGLLAEKRNDKAAARLLYMRVTTGYPRSDVVPLAREKLQSLGR